MSPLTDLDEPDLPTLFDLLASANPALGVDLRSSAAQSYIKRLASLPLNDLRHEPLAIASERSAVDAELVNLCYREYSTFTSVHRCSSAVGAAFDDFASSLGNLIESVPSLEQECRHFVKSNSSIQLHRRKAVMLQEHEDKLLNLLEVPQLMETCIRNGYYQEALDLASHVERVKGRVGTAIVEDVAEEVDGVLRLMATQLLAVLREPVKLPTLLKAVNYLRRLGSIDDDDLTLIFLSSRLHNYRARLIEIEKDRGDPVRYLRRYIDLFREHVFDVISQFTTIFHGGVDDQLASFACLCVDDLVDLVSRYVPRISSDTASMSSILVQLGYCSLSFARVGLDFSALIATPFTLSIQSAYEDITRSAADLVVEMMSVGSLDTTAPSALLIAGPHFQSILDNDASPPTFVDPADLHVPSPLFAYYPPLAQFLNAHLSALNALRLLAPAGNTTTLLAAQSRSIHRATEAVLEYLQHATALDEAAPLVRSNSMAKHSRTGSSPRAHLLRRNTETQLSSETLMARRREAKRACVAFADAWAHSITFARSGLFTVLEQSSPDDDKDLAILLERLRAWISAHAESSVTAANTSTTETPSRPSPTSGPSVNIDPIHVSGTDGADMVSPTSPPDANTLLGAGETIERSSVKPVIDTRDSVLSLPSPTSVLRAAVDDSTPRSILPGDVTSQEALLAESDPGVVEAQGLAGSETEEVPQRMVHGTSVQRETELSTTEPTTSADDHEAAWTSAQELSITPKTVEGTEQTASFGADIAPTGPEVWNEAPTAMSSSPEQHAVADVVESSGDATPLEQSLESSEIAPGTCPAVDHSSDQRQSNALSHVANTDEIEDGDDVEVASGPALPAQSPLTAPASGPKKKKKKKGKK